MPLLDLILKNLVHHALLLQHTRAAEGLARDVDGVHGAAAARDVADRHLRGGELGGEGVPDPGLGVVEEVGLLERWGRRGGGVESEGGEGCCWEGSRGRWPGGEGDGGDGS
jgi:hypothetical protein